MIFAKFQQGVLSCIKHFPTVFDQQSTSHADPQIHGCSRFVFHYFLGEWNNVYQEMGKGLTYTTCSRSLTEKKRELAWLKEGTHGNIWRMHSSAFSKSKTMLHISKAGKIGYKRIPVNTTIPKIADRPLK
jgi:hypothetical protein